MSKPVKNFMIRDYLDRMGDDPDVVLVNFRGVTANRNNEIRTELVKDDIRVTVIRNNLFRKAFEGKSAGALEPLLTGPNAVAYGAESVVEVARKFVELAKAGGEQIELRGAVLDGTLYAGEEGVERLSKFPTRDEAIAQDVTLVLSPGRNLVGQVLGPGRTLGGLVKAIEKKLEDGEAITKVG